MHAPPHTLEKLYWFFTYRRGWQAEYRLPNFLEGSKDTPFPFIKNLQKNLC
jgi:hypothetical protein